MSETLKANAPIDINFEDRAKQILSGEPILAAKDVEVQFTLRGKKLTAILTESFVMIGKLFKADASAKA